MAGNQEGDFQPSQASDLQFCSTTMTTDVIATLTTTLTTVIIVTTVKFTGECVADAKLLWNASTRLQQWLACPQTGNLTRQNWRNNQWEKRVKVQENTNQSLATFLWEIQRKVLTWKLMKVMQTLSRIRWECARECKAVDRSLLDVDNILVDIDINPCNWWTTHIALGHLCMLRRPTYIGFAFLFGIFYILAFHSRCAGLAGIR